MYFMLFILGDIYSRVHRKLFTWATVLVSADVGGRDKLGKAHTAARKRRAR